MLLRVRLRDSYQIGDGEETGATDSPEDSRARPADGSSESPLRSKMDTNYKSRGWDLSFLPWLSKSRWLCAKIAGQWRR